MAGGILQPIKWLSIDKVMFNEAYCVSNCDAGQGQNISVMNKIKWYFETEMKKIETLNFFGFEHGVSYKVLTISVT